VQTVAATAADIVPCPHAHAPLPTPPSLPAKKLQTVQPALPAHERSSGTQALRPRSWHPPRQPLLERL
jgi:hypothetical protein